MFIATGVSVESIGFIRKIQELPFLNDEAKADVR